ncbi:lysophospholipid acyltransferase family protein [Pedobacter antarcticus]|uniref:lysophospholipid acyltransferase family protein n=1 Tax=Pedobacter antarcticus TaxID=34086 RepID=UPI001C55BE3C|nr:lysophospholipid acyltransferase family protein [Pedobacter antarcticus]
MLGYFIGHVYKYRLSVCIQNLARAFPQFSYQDIRFHQYRFYRNLGRIVWEILFPANTKLKIDPAALKKIERLDSQNRPAVLLLGHYGNWEILNKLPQQIDVPVQALYKPLKNKLFNYLIHQKRTRYGVRLLPSGNAFRTILREKHQSSITLFIADQFPGNNNGIAVDFLKQSTFMFSGGEQLAKKLNAYVGYIELKPLQNHSWEMTIQTICENAADVDDDYITLTYTRKLEQSIRKDPSWWLWTHRRWK